MNLIKKYYLNILIVFVSLITIIYGFLHIYTNHYFNPYSFNELFINYQSGFIRRGLIGEIFWNLNLFFGILPKIFFGYIFLILHLIQIYFFYQLLKNFKKFYLIVILVLFSPQLILFSIYDYKVYFLKDILVKITFLIHAYTIVHLRQKKLLYLYEKKLRFIIVPLVAGTALFVHEYQIFFVGIHVLLSYVVFHEIDLKNNITKLKPYLILVVIFFLILVFIGNENQYDQLNILLEKFNAKLHPQLAGGLYKAIGGFYKWHFYYFTYKDFLNLFFAFILSIVLPFFIFHRYFIIECIQKDFFVKKKYLLFFIPTLLVFLLALDHGRNISLISFHLIIFYFALDINLKKLNIIYKKFSIKFDNNILSILFIFFYIFLWKLDQIAGFGGGEQINTIFQSSLFSEIIKFVKFLYSFLNDNIILLPEIRL